MCDTSGQVYLTEDIRPTVPLYFYYVKALKQSGFSVTLSNSRAFTSVHLRLKAVRSSIAHEFSHSRAASKLMCNTTATGYLSILIS